MSTPSEKNHKSSWHFPPDLLVLLGFPITVTVIALSLVVSFRGAVWLWATAVSFGIAVLGAALLFVAKLPLYRQRRFFTFGIEAIPPSSRGIYRWGCGLSIVGCILMLLLWMASISWR